MFANLYQPKQILHYEKFTSPHKNFVTEAGKVLSDKVQNLNRQFSGWKALTKFLNVFDEVTFLSELRTTFFVPL